MIQWLNCDIRFECIVFLFLVVSCVVLNKLFYSAFIVLIIQEENLLYPLPAHSMQSLKQRGIIQVWLRNGLLLPQMMFLFTYAKLVSLFIGSANKTLLLEGRLERGQKKLYVV